MQSIEGLIDRCEQAAKNSDAPFERRFADFTVWYFKNLKRIPKSNLQARVTFQEDAIWILIEIIAMQREDYVKLAEGRRSSLFLPSGIKLGGPLLSEQR
jgi:hypothetical protein